MKYIPAGILIAALTGANASAQSPDATFSEMLAQVYENNPQLQAEREQVAIADEKVSQAVAGFRPSISADAATGRQREKVDNSKWQYGQATNGSLTAVQPVFSGFGTLAQRRAADQRVLAARSKLLAVEQDVLLQAINGWLEISEKEAILNLAQDNLHRMYQYDNAMRERFKAGDGTQTDIAQAESRLAQAESRLAQAEADRDSAHAVFERATGLIAPAAAFPPVPPGLPVTADEAGQQARNSPELAQAAYQEKAAEQDIRAAKASLWPNVYLRGSMSEEHSPALGLDRLRNDTLTVNVSIPLYQGGAEYSRVREAKLARQKSHYDTVDIGRNVLERVRFAWNNYYAAQKVVNATQRAAESASKALSGVEEEQRQGLRTLTDVLDEQAELVNSQIAQAQAQKAIRLEAYRLLAATGQLTAANLHLPIRPHDPQEHYDRVAGRWIGF